MNKYAVFDIEGTGLDPATSDVHCIVIRYADYVQTYHNASFDRTGSLLEGVKCLHRLLTEGYILAGHNIIRYDIPNLMAKLGLRVTRQQLRGQIRDTLLWAKLLWPDIAFRWDLPWPQKKRVAGYGLADFGQRMKFPKGDPGGDWSVFTQQMLDYCVQDTAVNWQLLECLRSPAYNHNKELPALCLEDENEFCWLMFVQQRHGWPFDTLQAHRLLEILQNKYAALASQLEGLVPPKVVTGAMPSYYMHPEYPGRKWPTKSSLNKYLSEHKTTDTIKSRVQRIQAGPPTKKEIPWNPGSREQVKELLYSKYQWTPTIWASKGGKDRQDHVTPSEYEYYTDKGWHPVIDDGVLTALGEQYPELRPLAEYYYVSKMLGMLHSGSKAHMKSLGVDNRIHGRVDSTGCLGGRCTHSSPNVAQVPACNKSKPLNAEFRKCYGTLPGYKVLGFDASALEYRMMAHYGYNLDGGMLRDIVDDPEKDLHWEFTKRYGMVDCPNDQPRDESNKAWESARSASKAITYGIPYGAQPPKVARMLGVSKGKAQEFLRQLSGSLPGMVGLRDKVTKAVEARGETVRGKYGKSRYKAYTGYLKGLDGRLCTIRSSHASLNTLLQGAGGIFMKTVCRFFVEECLQRGLAVYGVDKQSLVFPQGQPYHVALVGNIHDEVQTIVREDKVQEATIAAQEAFVRATQYHGLKCPVSGEVKVGSSWADTH